MEPTTSVLEALLPGRALPARVDKRRSIVTLAVNYCVPSDQNSSVKSLKQNNIPCLEDRVASARELVCEE